MLLRSLVRVLSAVALASTLITATEAHAKTQVDLELVLAVDVSLSMDLEEQRLQRDGYVAAFRDPNIIKAIQSGPNGRIAVAYLEWAGAGIQSAVLPWRVLSNAQEAEAFAADLAAKPISRALMTSISEAIGFSAMMIASNEIDGLRRVIDVSGDGPNNSGRAVEAARDSAVSAGIVINGLAIQIGTGGGAYNYFDLPDLERYYKDCVIAGPGSFVLTIKEKQEFATATRQKLLLEIAGLTPELTARPVRRIQFQQTPEKYDCLIGEKLWQRYRRYEP